MNTNENIANTPKGEFKNFKEAAASVQGTKFKVITKYMRYIDANVSIGDLVVVSDVAIWNTWKHWKPATSKFNTYAYSMIGWGIQDELNEMHPKFKNNTITTYELCKEGDGYKEIKLVGKTKDEVFNKQHELVGVSTISKINRDLFNQYVAYQTSKRRPLYMINESQFRSDGSEDFNIFDTVTTELNLNDIMDDHDADNKYLPPEKRLMAKLIMDGMSVAEIAIMFKMTKNSLLKTFAPMDDNARQRYVSPKIRKLATKKLAEMD